MIQQPVFVSAVKEPLTLTRLENNTKPEKPKPLRRKTVADSFMAPLLDNKSTQNPSPKGMKNHEEQVKQDMLRNKFYFSVIEFIFYCFIVFAFLSVVSKCRQDAPINP